MTNPTSNFGWQMPTSTDLVTDLPADFEVFGQAVDTSLADLKGGTTGQVLKKNTNTDMDFVWAADAAGMTNPMTTTGDTIYSSSGSTPARLGIGTTGQILTVAGGIPSWAAPAAGGGMTLLSTTTLSGATTTISSINQTYTSLIGYMFGANLSANDYPRMNPNATRNTANSSIFNVTLGFEPDDWFISSGNSSVTASNTNNAWTFQIDNYASTTANKPIQWFGSFASAGTGNIRSVIGAGGFKSNTAVTSLEIICHNGATYSAGTVLLYGVK
jgi:hypothetical protein